ncbi:MAG TPA: four helix bundle protein [Pyrinomonadaceae bacterium]|nr:four helix bundle protein [Pyrinomonadaceae bacterium]
MKSRTFEDVEVWRKAHAWVLAIYRFTESFPKHELFGLTSQLRRAAVSVPANFAEGFKKRGIADKVCIYNIAQGSLEECRYFLILARDLQYGDSQTLMTALEEISKMLESYSRSTKEYGFS